MCPILYVEYARHDELVCVDIYESEIWGIGWHIPWGTKRSSHSGR